MNISCLDRNSPELEADVFARSGSLLSFGDGLALASRLRRQALDEVGVEGLLYVCTLSTPGLSPSELDLVPQLIGESREGEWRWWALCARGVFSMNYTKTATSYQEQERFREVTSLYLKVHLDLDSVVQISSFKGLGYPLAAEMILSSF